MPYKNLEDARRYDREYVAARKEAAGGAAPFVKPMVTIKVKGAAHGLRIAVIPDCQVKPGVPVDHLRWVSDYLVRKQPDVIVMLGDFCDMPSLSTHEQPGSLRLEGTRYKKDLESVHRGMDLVTSFRGQGNWNPRMLLTRGNHEDRITRAVTADKKLEGFMSLADLRYEEYGWEVFPFLQPVTVGGVAFCHYFPSGVMGRPISSARQLLTKLHMSAFAGHQQDRDMARSKRADGKSMTAIISGSFYQHAEDYLSPFTNNHWRGMYMLHEVRDGEFDEMAVSISYLKRKFKGGK